MKNAILCEKCGKKMIPQDSNKPVGMICPSCGWGYITSYVEPIYIDETVYEIKLLNNSDDSHNVKIISNITGENYLTSREFLNTFGSIIFKGKAPEVMKIRTILVENKLMYEITPKFEY